MIRNVRIVLLCEDLQQQVFVLRFLEGMGLNIRDLRVEQAPHGIGSAEQFVRENFPDELHELRKLRHENRYLLVITDGDQLGVSGRKKSLKDECIKRRVSPPTNEDSVVVCLPTWNIETWLAYLRGETVDETRSDYPRLARQRECANQVKELIKMCLDRALRAPYPPSLAHACEEYRRVFG